MKNTVPTFKNHFHNSPRQGEINSGDIQTISGLALSVKEMITRHQAGILPPIGKNPVYSGSQNFEDFDRTQDPAFDLSDATAEKRELETTIANHRKEKQRIKDEQSNAEKLRLQADAKELEELRLKNKNPLKEQNTP